MSLMLSYFIDEALVKLSTMMASLEDLLWTWFMNMLHGRAASIKCRIWIIMEDFSSSLASFLFQQNDAAMLSNSNTMLWFCNLWGMQRNGIKVPINSNNNESEGCLLMKFSGHLIEPKKM